MTVAAGSWTSLTGAEPQTYAPHVLHGPGRAYQETNCYADILVELLHARGLEPLAALGPTVRTDFEGDQWTFFKPAPHDLEVLFGVDIHEMQPYRPLPEQIEEQLAGGRTVIVELDAWYLPDTRGTSYRAEHVKTSVAAEAIDRDAERLRYFHNLALHELEGEDYRGALRLDGAAPDVLPPYAELVRFDAGRPLHGDELRAASLELLRGHLACRPSANPFPRFGARLAADLPGLVGGDEAGYHAYAFATVRMAGAAFELCADHVDWLLGPDGAPASAALREIVEGSKLLNFKLARRRPFDPEPYAESLAGAWGRAMDLLDAAAG